MTASTALAIVSPAAVPEIVPGWAARARPASWAGLEAAWLEELRQRTGSVRTPGEYRRHVRRFLDEHGLAGDPARAGMPAAHSFGYSVGPSGKTPSPATILVRLAAVRSFYDFARRAGLVTSNPADDVRRPRASPPVPRGLDAEEVMRLLRAVPRTLVGQRDRAIVLLCVLMGLRRSEVMGIRAGDIHQNGRPVLSWRAKGGKMRMREIPEPAAAALRAYLEADGVPLGKLPAEARLFKVSVQGVYSNMKRYARKAKIPDFSPHVLRHTCAKLRRDAGATLEDVQAQLGHASLSTTSRYLARLEGEEDRGWAGVAEAIGVAKAKPIQEERP